MKLWAIGDLHLSFNQEGQLKKPMDIFGHTWDNHAELIRKNWKERVRPEDVVLLPGDFSWAMDLEEMKPDVAFLSALPGKKVMLRGNHDYWWTSMKKMKAFFPPDMVFIQNNHYQITENLYICGSRGWTVGDENQQSPEDHKIYLRELARLRLSLESVPDSRAEKIVMLHYPPANAGHDFSQMVALLQEFQVTTCIYAHLHDVSVRNQLPREKWGIRFILTSADALGFSPCLIREIS